MALWHDDGRDRQAVLEEVRRRAGTEQRPLRIGRSAGRREEALRRLGAQGICRAACPAAWRRRIRAPFPRPPLPQARRWLPRAPFRQAGRQARGGPGHAASRRGSRPHAAGAPSPFAGGHVGSHARRRGGRRGLGGREARLERRPPAGGVIFRPFPAHPASSSARPCRRPRDVPLRGPLPSPHRNRPDPELSLCLTAPLPPRGARGTARQCASRRDAPCFALWGRAGAGRGHRAGRPGRMKL